MERKNASDYPQELLDLFHEYQHGDMDRRTFIDSLGKFATGGLTALLRAHWRLNEILGLPHEKNRADHRQHAQREPHLQVVEIMHRNPRQRQPFFCFASAV